MVCRYDGSSSTWRQRGSHSDFFVQLLIFETSEIEVGKAVLSQPSSPKSGQEAPVFSTRDCRCILQRFLCLSLDTFQHLWLLFEEHRNIERSLGEIAFLTG